MADRRRATVPSFEKGVDDTVRRGRCSHGAMPPKSLAAYAQRDVEVVMNVHGRWDGSAREGQCVSRSREFFDAARPFAMGGVYVNFMTEEETDRIGAAYGPNYERLARIKQ
jgi:hypothetical protein